VTDEELVKFILWDTGEAWFTSKLGGEKAYVEARVAAAFAAVRAEEREACAKTVPASWLDPMLVGAPDSLNCPSVEWISKKIAAAIRARGSK